MVNAVKIITSLCSANEYNVRETKYESNNKTGVFGDSNSRDTNGM